MVTIPKPSWIKCRVQPSRFERFGRGSSACSLIAQQGIDHHVADKTDAVGRYPFTSEVVGSASLSGVEKVGNLIGQDAIDFFRHGTVIAAQASLDVYDRVCPS
jgi:hypothetical protein